MTNDCQYNNVISDIVGGIKCYIDTRFDSFIGSKS